jgi:hypothetical protein
MTFWSINGNSAAPYVSIGTSGITITNGTFTSPVISGGSLAITTSSGTVWINASTSGVYVFSGSDYTQATTNSFIAGSSSGFGRLMWNQLMLNGVQVMGLRIATRPVSLTDVINAGVTHGWWN